MRNNGVVWTPTSSSASSKAYNLQSNGLFEVIAGGVVVFSWHNHVSQDFTISAIYTSNHEDPMIPGIKIADKSYLQVPSRTKSSLLSVLIESAGTDISGLELSATNNATITKREKLPEYGNKYLRLSINFENSATGEPAEVRVGNVLVVYIAELTA